MSTRQQHEVQGESRVGLPLNGITHLSAYHAQGGQFGRRDETDTTEMA